MSLENDIETAASAISCIIGSVESAAKVVAEMCRRHPGFIHELHNRLKMQVSVGYLRRLERCGNGELHPALCLCVGPGQPFIEKLSRADQEAIINGVKWPDGDSHRIRPLSELEYYEAKAAFFGGAIADVDTIRRRILTYHAQREAQLRAFESNKQEGQEEIEAAIRMVESFGITYNNGMVVIPKNTKIHAEHLATWLSQRGVS